MRLVGAGLALPSLRPGILQGQGKPRPYETLPWRLLYSCHYI